MSADATLPETTTGAGTRGSSRSAGFANGTGHGNGHGHGHGHGHGPSSAEHSAAGTSRPASAAPPPLSARSAVSTAASDDSTAVDPLTRTFLTAPLRKPTKNFVSIRQNTEALDAKEVSPMMQEFLGAKHSSVGFRQMLARTVPVSWCPAGGVDTHRRRQVPKELHDAISAKLAKSQHDFARVGALGHRRKIAAARQVERACSNILSGGQTRVSQAVLDLVKRQRERGKDKKDKDGGAGDEEEEDEAPPGVDLLADIDGDLDEFLDALE